MLCLFVCFVCVFCACFVYLNKDSVLCVFCFGICVCLCFACLVVLLLGFAWFGLFVFCARFLLCELGVCVSLIVV